MFEALILMLAAAEGAAVAAPALAAKAGSRCERTRAEEPIVVCGRSGEADRYRLPPQDEPFDPYGTLESVSRERHRLLGPVTGGIGSCSTVGPGGWTGCDLQVIKQAEQQGKRVGIGNSRASLGLQVGRRYVGTDGKR